MVVVVVVRPVWEGVSMDSLNFTRPRHARPLYVLRAGAPPKRPYGRLGSGPPAGWAACGRLLSAWIPLPVRAWWWWWWWWFELQIQMLNTFPRCAFEAQTAATWLLQLDLIQQLYSHIHRLPLRDTLPEIK
jgi:hypothetical protein